MQKRIFFLFIFLFTSFLSSCNTGIPGTTLPPNDSNGTKTLEGTSEPANSTIEAGAWISYSSVQAGYSVEYPAGWTVGEQPGGDGSFTTTFISADGSTGITMLVQEGEFGSAGSLDIPNTRCEEVKTGNLYGTRCMDSLSASSSTTFVGQGKTYIITSTSKRLDQAVYDHFLASFQIH